MIILNRVCSVADAQTQAPEYVPLGCQNALILRAYRQVPAAKHDQLFTVLHPERSWKDDDDDRDRQTQS